MIQLFKSKTIGIFVRNLTIISLILLVTEFFSPWQVSPIIGIPILIAVTVLSILLSVVRIALFKRPQVWQLLLGSLSTSILTTLFVWFELITSTGALIILISLGAVSILILGKVRLVYNEIFRPIYAYSLLVLFVFLVIRGLESAPWVMITPWALQITQFLGEIEIIIIGHIVAFAWILIDLGHRFNTLDLSTSRKKEVNQVSFFWKTPTIVAILLIIGFVSVFFRLGYYDFHDDEYIGIAAAKTYSEGLGFYKWDWIENTSGEFTDCVEVDRYCHYRRAWPHTIMIAQAYRIFGVSEWSSRLVSALFGLLFAGVVYPISLYFTKNKWIALLASLALILSPRNLNLFRFTRMYSILVPTFFILMYTLSRGLRETSTFQFMLNTVQKPQDSLENIRFFFQKYFNFRYGYLAISLILIYFLYNIHVNSLIILPITGVYVFLLYVFTRESRYLGLMVVGSVLVSMMTGLVLLNNRAITNSIALFTRTNFTYIDLSVMDPYGVEVGLLLLIFSIFSIRTYIKEKKYQIIFPQILLWFGLVVFIWIADRYVSRNYFSHIIPFATILIISGLHNIISIFPIKSIRQVTTILAVVGILVNFSTGIGDLYGDNGNRTQASIAYQTIADNIDPSSEVLFGQFIRTYYAKDIGLESDRIISLLARREYPYKKFIEDIQIYEKGWIAWEVSKSHHIDPSIRSFIHSNMQAYHTPEMDQTRFYVYYFDVSDIDQTALNSL